MTIDLPHGPYPSRFIKAVNAVGDALDKLAAQGSPGQIRDFLVAQKIPLGVPSNSRACPVYNLVVKVADSYDISVTTHKTTVRAPDLVATLPNPMVVTDFITAFDTKGFPELIQPGQR